ncbi:MAG: histidine phosphatase family protein [SAR324 cluster bacterium]|nr:histidine phosphatase family protein [SAR324 cluster bacterium]
MKTVYLLRHAKSSWDDPYLDDHDRPLAPRGLKAAPIMGQVLASFENPPTLAISSTAARAHHTATIVSNVFHDQELPLAVKTDARIYGASLQTLLEIMQALPSQQDTVLLVGHNPEMEGIVSILCTGRVEGNIRMPTAAAACLTFDVGAWDQIGGGYGTLNVLITPKLAKRLVK